MSLQELEAAKRTYEESRGFIYQNAKDAIKNECVRLFAANPGLDNIQFAQKASEYNDEGLYPGIYGPVANRSLKEENDSGWYELPAWLDEYSSKTDTPSAYDSSLGELRRILSAAGESILADIFGDSKVVVRRDEEKGVSMVAEYVDY